MKSAFKLLPALLTLICSVAFAMELPMYEYWFDNDYDSHRSGELTQDSFTLDISLPSLPQGIHTFCIQMLDTAENRGSIFRRQFLVSDIEPGTTSYEYWLDNDYDGRKEGEMTDGSVSLLLDMEPLPAGLHCITFRMKDALGQWGAPFRRHFYANPSDSRIDSYQYWIDNDIENAQTGKYTGDNMAFDVSLDGIQKSGVHTFSIRYREADGTWGAPFTRIFSFLKAPDKAPMVGYRHWINGKDMGYTAFETHDTVSKLFDIALPEELRIRAMKRQYKFDADTVAYACTDSIHVVINLETEEGWCAPIRRDMQISAAHSSVAKEMKTPSFIRLNKPSDTEFHAVRFSADGSPLYVRADQEASLEIYSNGVMTDSIGGADLKNIKQLTLKAGTYFGILHSAPKNDTNPSDSLTFHLMDTPNKLRMPEIAFNALDSTVVIDPVREGALAYYTIDGSSPTVKNGIRYTGKFRLDHNATVQAIATLPGLDIEDSDVAMLIVDSYKVADPSIRYNNLLVEITQSEEEGVTTHFTLDGSEPTGASEEYTSPLDLAGRNATIRARSFKEGWNPSETAEFRYTHADYVVKAPLITFTGTTVTISKDQDDCTLWYSTESDDPALMMPYENPFTMDRNGTVYAQARRDGYFPSTVAREEINDRKVETPTISYDGHTVAILSADPLATVHVTVDNPDMTNAAEYAGEFDAGGLHTIRALATRDGYHNSDVAELAIKAYSDPEHAETSEGGCLGDAFPWIGTQAMKEITHYTISGELNEEDYATIRAFSGLRSLNLTGVTSPDIPDRAFEGMQLATLALPAATENYGDDLFHGNTSLSALFVGAPAALPSSAFGNFRNPNLLLYASESYIAANGKESPGAAWIKNVVEDGKSPFIETLTLTGEGGWFNCPKAFVAGEARFVKSFSKQTEIGGSQGWETLSLPFDVDEIRNGERQLVPFGAYTGSDNYYPFWLYGPDGTSWHKESIIIANRPYIISMPNCPDYDESFNISGTVTFIGRNQTIEATAELKGTAFSPLHTLWPNFSNIPSEEELLVVNHSDAEGYAPGAVFIKGEHDVSPFECYVTSSSARRAIPIFDPSDIDVIMEFAMEIRTEHHDLLIRSPYPATLRLHDLNGQLICIVKAEAGAITRIPGLTPGIYFIGGRKILVK